MLIDVVNRVVEGRALEQQKRKNGKVCQRLLFYLSFSYSRCYRRRHFFFRSEIWERIDPKKELLEKGDELTSELISFSL